MCGIFGQISIESSAIEQTLKGLKLLEYRGYDSAGIAGISEGKLICFKEVGKVGQLEKILNKTPSSIAIGHTRWATHGVPSQRNAHPHFDSDSNLGLVHNGILENHAALRHMLWEKGVEFRSDTDTEVIAQLIAHLYEGDPLDALQRAVSMMEGFWALALIDRRHPDQIFATVKGNPLLVGLSPKKDKALIASDPHAFARSDLEIYFLKDMEVASIQVDRVHFFDRNAKKVNKSSERLDICTRSLSKGSFDHFMLKEIHQQPQTIQSALHSRFLLEPGTAQFEGLFSSSELLAVERITIIGCGTSWHAGCIAASLFENIARIPAQVEIASEFRYKNPLISEKTLVIALSQSGETIDTLAAMREVQRKGAKVLAICNVPSSTLVREADAVILQRAGPEISVCSTKAFTSQLAILALFALQMARLHHMSQEEGALFLSNLLALPEIVTKVLGQKEAIAKFTQKYAELETFFFIGRHYMYPTALEAALKLKEISYINANGYPAGELKHGPIALIDDNCGVVGLCGNKKTLDKSLSNLEEVKARGGHILALVPEKTKHILDITKDVLFLPPVCDELAPIPYSIACQLFAYYIALKRGTDIDQPRNLAKSVTVE